MRVAQARETDVPRSLRFGKFGFKGFAAAGKCANALTDAGQFFRGVRRLEQGIQVGQGVYNVYDGLNNGSAVQVGLGLLGMKAGIRGTQLPCFPAGTLVSTPDGPRAIESILSGDWVWSYDLRQQQWRSCMVSYHSQIAYDDLIVTVRARLRKSANWPRCGRRTITRTGSSLGRIWMSGPCRISWGTS